MESVVYNLQDYLEYKERIDRMVDAPKDEVIFNGSLIHAVMIQCGLVRLATRNGVHEVKVFCGNMSAFRSGTEAKIAAGLEESKRLDSANCNSPEWENLHPYADLQEALVDYLQAHPQNKIRIIVEKDIENIKQDQRFMSVFAPFLQNGKMVVCRAKGNLGYSHFMLVGNAYRMEESDNEKTAMCNFGDTVMTPVLQQSFDILAAQAEPVDLVA